MSYVDGFVAAVPTANRDAYLAHAREAAVVFKDHSALRVVEGWGDDVPQGKVNSFHTAVMRKDDGAVIFSWVVWPDKATREAGWAAVMADPRMAPDRASMPFDGQRMIYGGFDVILDVE
jgi:uncharacterized protein YbaA (DUF1428 family)